MESKFNQWINKLSEIANEKGIIIDAKYYDGLMYMFEGEKLTPEEAFPRYINLVKRCKSILNMENNI